MESNSGCALRARLPGQPRRTRRGVTCRRRDTRRTHRADRARPDLAPQIGFCHIAPGRNYREWPSAMRGSPAYSDLVRNFFDGSIGGSRTAWPPQLLARYAIAKAEGVTPRELWTIRRSTNSSPRVRYSFRATPKSTVEAMCSAILKEHTTTESPFTIHTTIVESPELTSNAGHLSRVRQCVGSMPLLGSIGDESTGGANLNHGYEFAIDARSS